MEANALLPARGSPAKSASPTAFSEEDLVKLIELRRREAGIVFKEPERISANGMRILTAPNPPPRLRPGAAPLTPEQLEAHEAAMRRREAEDRWVHLARIRGKRYVDCRLSNYAAETDLQQQAVKTLRDYCENVAVHIRDGKGVVLFGPRGTGKDHLAMAVSRAAVLASARVTWVNGLDFYGDVRDAMGADGDKESTIIDKLARPDLLYLSDPLPITGPLSAHQMNTLFRVLDRRYSERRATLCTVNVANGSELEERMGPQNADRLKDGAIAIFCNWSSHRKVADA